jgi:hypothetical protein
MMRCDSSEMRCNSSEQQRGDTMNLEKTLSLQHTSTSILSIIADGLGYTHAVLHFRHNVTAMYALGKRGI